MSVTESISAWRSSLLPALAVLTLAAVLIAAGPLGAGALEYVDVTEASGIDFMRNFGDDHLTSILESTGSGCAFLDYDNDGWIDLYVVNGCYIEGISDVESEMKGVKTTSRLFRNKGKGAFEDVTKKAGLEVCSYGMAAIPADYDNDGDTDIYLTNYCPGEKDTKEKDIPGKNQGIVFRNILFRNKGDGTFEDATEKAGVGKSLWSVGAVFFDYDKDGWLDLFVGNYLEFDSGYRLYYVADEFPGPLSYPAQNHFLYHNNRDGTFTDVSKAAGITKKGRGMGANAADFDNDGYPDLFVANDAMGNFLYKNMGNGTFKDIAIESGTAFSANGDYASAMNAVIGDYDHDGLLDIFIPDIKYKNLFRNLGKDAFEEVNTSSGIAEFLGQFASWGGGFLDMDNDGDLDLWVTNGSDHRLDTQENVLLENVPGPEGTRIFHDIGPKSGKYFHTKNVGRGTCFGDIDNDGDIDVFVVNLEVGRKSQLVRNEGGNRSHWILIRLAGTRSNRDGVGARVAVKTGDLTQIREKGTADSYLSQNDPRLHFGLGTRTKIDSITVRWPSGAVQEMKDVPADQVLKIQEPESK
jgi:hypothetical protein